MSPKNTSQKGRIDNSPLIHQRPKLKEKIPLTELKWTEKQINFIELARGKNTQVILVKGPAGTSKTAVSIFSSLILLNERKVSDIVLVRSIVESADNKIGFLPGSADDKMYPYMIPFYDKLDMFISENDIKKLESDKRLSAYPIGFLRGMDFNVKAIISDESQNMTKKELLTFMTRIGQFCKTFIIGDTTQCDITKSGFDSVFNLFNCEEAKEQGIFCFEFYEEDILRSNLCKYITHKFKELEMNK